MASSAAPDPRRRSTPPAVLSGLVSAGGGMRRIFVDAIGTSVPMPASVRRLVATDDQVGAFVLGLGGTLLGCAGDLDGVEPLGPARAPDPAAVAALKPDLIIVGAVDGGYDLAHEQAATALWRVAPLVAVDLRRAEAAEKDLRALLGPAAAPRAGGAGQPG